MNFKQNFKYFFLISILLLLAVLTLLPHLVPVLLEKEVTKRVSNIKGLKNFKINIHNIGVSGIDLGRISTGKSLFVDSVHLDYSLNSLLNKKTDTLLISGVDLKACVKDSHIEFTDFDMEAADHDSSKKQLPDLSLVPFLPGKILISHSSFSLIVPGSQIVVPFGAEILIKKKEKQISIVLNLFPFGEKIEIAAIIDMKKGLKSVEIKADSFCLDHFHSLFAQYLPDLSIYGNTDIVISKKTDTPWHLSLSEINIVKPVKTTISNLMCTLELESGGTDALAGKGAEDVSDLSVKASGSFVSVLSLLNGMPPVKVNYSCELKNRDLWNLSLKGETEKGETDKPHRSTTCNSPNCKRSQGTADARRRARRRTHVLQVPANTAAAVPCERLHRSTTCNFVNKDIKACIKDFTFELSAMGKGLKGKMDFFAGLGLVNAWAENHGIKIDILNPELNGHGNFDFNEKGNGFDCRFKIDSSEADIVSDDFYLKFPGLKIPGTVHISKTLMPKVKINPFFVHGRAGYDKYGVEIADINLNIPLSIPFDAKTGKGTFSAVKVLHKGENAGRISGEISQSKAGAMLHGNAIITGFFKSEQGKINTQSLADHSEQKAMKFKPDQEKIKTGDDSGLSTPPLNRLKFDQHGIKLHFSSKAEFYSKKDKALNAKIEFKTEQKRISSNILKKDLLDFDTDMEFSLFFASNGNIEINNNKISSMLNLDISHGDFSMEDSNFSAHGINTNLKFNDILSLRSVPGQLLTIETITINDIKISNARFLYSIESDESLLLEHCDFNWCHGMVSTGAVRIMPGKENYGIILFCDRLRLSEILKQVGSFQAQGEGSLNGKIPVKYSKGNISFNNGFLFSTPGKGGVIRITGAEMLTAGLPSDSIQFAQIDLAREALKNYNYKWARLNFNTRGEDLIVNMEFDGKPENLLPFVYKKEVGGFVRVEASTPGSHFQGIEISVNFKLPFNKVLKFGSRLNQMLNN
ncbi:MAG: YdbH domain-containing protein [Thermodesulfobacteriota bacterium]|nr:YdbH domain-containing protein [Thermodesulfobacteriota bacterium]